MEHQQDESVTGIETPFGSLTLIASTGDRIVVATSGRGRERPLRVRDRYIRAEFELRFRAGKWTVSEDSFFLFCLKPSMAIAFPHPRRRG
jgi:hypothetical protein